VVSASRGLIHRSQPFAAPAAGMSTTSFTSCGTVRSPSGISIVPGVDAPEFDLARREASRLQHPLSVIHPYRPGGAPRQRDAPSGAPERHNCSPLE
jgi:hypothetical protein